jgi:hypothetical protein
VATARTELGILYAVHELPVQRVVGTESAGRVAPGFSAYFVSSCPTHRWPLRSSQPTCIDCYAGGMTVTLHLDGAVAEALAAEAARRGQNVDQLAAALLAAQLPRAPRRRLAFAAVGASTSGRGAAEADEMLAEGFGRD